MSRVTEQALEQQSRQNEAMADLQKNLQQERSHLDEQRAQLEEERRSIAAARHRDPLIANAIIAAVGLLVAVLPLGLCWHLLRGLYRPGDDSEALGELLVQEMTSDRPLILPPASTLPALDDGSRPFLPPAEPPAELPSPDRPPA
ncbi:MAG: hypothetical protein AB7E74_20675 [Pirellulales bacterium]